MHVFTTKGVLTPFIFKRGTPVKIVFRDERAGKPTDIFAVPLSELTAGQQAKSPLMENNLDFSKPSEPPTGKPTEAKKAAFRRAMGLLNELAANVDKSPRARHNLAGWKRSICWKTAGGNATLRISDGRLAIAEGAPRGEADLVMISENPQLLIDWMTFKEALTNAIINGKLWISLNREFTTVFKLDRLPRSVHRDRR
jgi:hypothetical protein